ncbi:hypothetical protein PIB30_015745 [Stylosanthes scabra]|uniref:Uncharacterized protein n=1 Tax=Stylosanthes scabra TaxID=79078 RepID=A0ABU6X630_9FABA|nr:hypothetical protein [Stylosanthes scabra]
MENFQCSPPSRRTPMYHEKIEGAAWGHQQKRVCQLAWSLSPTGKPRTCSSDGNAGWISSKISSTLVFTGFSRYILGFVGVNGVELFGVVGAGVNEDVVDAAGRVLEETNAIVDS